jgi:hypothetical protein
MSAPEAEAAQPVAAWAAPEIPAGGQSPSTFRSVLFAGPCPREQREAPMQPACFVDLRLDQVVAEVTAGREEHRLAPLIWRGPVDAASVAYRQEVFEDLRRREVAEPVRSFAKAMRQMRDQLAIERKLHYKYQKQRWFLDAVGGYCSAVADLARDLRAAGPESRGLRGLLCHLDGYVSSAAYLALAEDVARVREALGAIEYLLHIKGNRVRVREHGSEADYSAEVLATFQKFAQGAAKDYRVGFPSYAEMNHVEAQVLDLVARLFPEPFSALDELCARHGDYLDEVVADFDHEIQVFLAYLEHIAPLEAAGLAFCIPEVSVESKDVFARDTFDLALASSLVARSSPVVCNDFRLEGIERIFVVSGPNQGGKTTFARTFGQLHYLAGIGFPVPGSAARLHLYDKLFTHFEREEALALQAGKLEDDIVRMRQVLISATPESVVVVNEAFSATTLADATFLGTRVMERLVELDLLGVYVTFVDELASSGPTTVSMVSTVDPDNPSERTYKILRRPADGLAYAVALAARRGLTLPQLRQRLAGGGQARGDLQQAGRTSGGPSPDGAGS